MKKIAFWVCLSLIFSGPIFGETAQQSFDQPRKLSPRDLYKSAHESFSAGKLDDARLYALRVFFDGFRSENLLNLLAAIELRATGSLLARAWLQKTLSLNPANKTARKIWARFSPHPRPIPMESQRLADHFAEISRKLPILLKELVSARLHADSIYKEIERGSFYKALATSEEYEKRYPGANGVGLTALCAFFLGRCPDAENLVAQGLTKNKYQPTLLFVKAMLEDTHPKTSAPNLAMADYYKDRWTEAIKASQLQTKIFPRSADGLLVQALISYQGLRFDEAKKLLNAAEERDSDNPMVGMIYSDILFRTKLPGPAIERLKRAFRRGYNLPSVSLKMGVIAALTQKYDEARAILKENESFFPFVDREAYPAFARLAIEVGDMQLARRALDEWKRRFKASGDFFYHEAFYQIKAGDGLKSLECIRRAFRKNPNFLPYLQDLLKEPLFDVDPELGAQLRARLAHAGGAPKQIESPRVSAPPIPAPIPVKSPPPAPTKVTTGSGETGVEFVVAPTIPFALAEKLKQAVGSALSRLENFFGQQVKTIPVELVDSLDMGSRVAYYDFLGGKLKVSALYADFEKLKEVVESERPDLEPSLEASLLDGLPMEILVEEMALAYLVRKHPKLGSGREHSLWMSRGLAQIIGNENEVLRDRLVFTQGTISGGQMKLISPEEVNKIFYSSSNSAMEIQNANTHAYLMVSFLVKRGADLADGVNRLLQLSEMVSGKVPFEKALLETFGLSKQVFDSGWKDAAYWALQQGLPYEW